MGVRNNMKCKIYISDEGFGPVVRQRAILEELRRLEQGIEAVIQTRNHMDDAKRIVPHSEFIKRYNNIAWVKSKDGSPDVRATKNKFSDYLSRSDSFVERELKEFKSDFVISDFVYEAFEVGHRKKIPSFGVAHFTWDWFFSKLYPPPLETSVLERFFDFGSKASVMYFPPFTPNEIIHQYKKNAFRVPMIVRKNISHKKISKPGKFNVLLVDSGAGVLQYSIRKALKAIGQLDDVHFFVSSSFKSKEKNVSFIDRHELFIDYINDMDLVIGRAGFNTISECIALRTPMLLLSEGSNPEMNENIINIKHEGLGSFISIRQFEEGLAEYLPRFVKGEYRNLLENMKNHSIPSNGAEIIAKDILKRL